MSEDPTVQHDEEWRRIEDPNYQDDKDCTDQLTECHSECDITDKECISECIEEYHECEIPRPEEEIADHFMTSEEQDKGELISECLQIAALLGGTCERVETLNSTGRASKKIIIEYDVKTVELQS
tara:strand:- start:115 stop:489 length:375 start_codon:yes stop_codon:yes gene_type:complete